MKRTFTFNGRNYAMLLPAVRIAMPIATRVATVIAPILPVLKMESTDGMSRLFSAISNISPDILDSLMQSAIRAGKLCTGDNQPINADIDFERYFSQYREDVYAVCLWCLWECVKDFLPATISSQASPEVVAKAFQFPQAVK